jgi:hypothetical protein
MDLLLLLWLLLDNAEQLMHACLFAVAACAWGMAAVVVGMVGILISR